MPMTHLVCSVITHLGARSIIAWGSRDAHPKTTALPRRQRPHRWSCWFDTPRGHAAGLTVDNLKPRPVDHGQAGTPNQRIRDDLHDEVNHRRRSQWFIPRVWQERGVFLTDEYFDVFANRSNRERRYEWSLSGAGTLRRAAGLGSDQRIKWFHALP